MSVSHRTASDGSTADSIRKRVGKACDRCRMKKSKCDGNQPCARCQADNAICVFGERKKSRDKVYPKGYVEVLEHQQSQLVLGVQEMYHRLLSGQGWPGPPLSEAKGHPLTHDILAQLDVLEPRQQSSEELNVFEEDFRRLQERLLSGDATDAQRRSSTSSDSEFSQLGHSRSESQCTSFTQNTPLHQDAFVFDGSSPSLHTPDLMARRRKPQQSLSQLDIGQPACHSPLSNSDRIMSSGFPHTQIHASGPHLCETTFDRLVLDLQTAAFQPDPCVYVPEAGNQIGFMGQAFDSSAMYDTPMIGFSAFGTTAPSSAMLGMFPDWSSEPVDVDFSRYVQVGT
ncbi:Fluconazole resistance protein 1 [Elasticomyces elasticus]|nr:Fluconazole resistance protein 1 [Elasticomyces elasticus]